MFYIKLEDDMSLVVTVREPIYRGDNLSHKIRYLLPLTIAGVDTQATSIYLNYVRADGAPDVLRLERMEEKYNGSYYQYTFPVTSKLTKFPGQVCTWLHIFAGDPRDPIISKSGECVLMIEDSKNMDDYICDHQLTALYQLEKSLSGEIDEVAELVENKADGLAYNAESRELQLKSNGENIGEPVVVPADDYDGGDDDDEWSDMTDTEESNDTVWEPM